MSTLLTAICYHARPTTLAALIADIETDPDAQLDSLETLRAGLFANIGAEEGELLIAAERSSV